MSIIGKGITLIKMVKDPYTNLPDPNPVLPGTKGTITHVGGGVINVDWNNGRSLGVIMDQDI